MNPSVARRLWLLSEPLHAAVYFAPEATEAYRDAGLKGYWMGYFASRSAAMGAAAPGVVIATFYNFAPAMVRRALPDAWSYSTPTRVLEARWSVADAALRRLLGDAVDGPEVAEADRLAWQAVESGDAAGRPLFAAHAELERPSAPHLRLWHALTALREYRGDGHVSLLLTSELDGCEANVVAAATGLVPREVQRERRGWSEEQWAAAAERLRSRGLLDGQSALTPGGLAARDAVEAQTDMLALAPYRVLGDDGVDRLEQQLRPLARRLADAQAIPYPNPVGVPPAF